MNVNANSSVEHLSNPVSQCCGKVCCPSKNRVINCAHGCPQGLGEGGWNKDLELLIYDIQDKSWSYTWLHNASVSYFSKWSNRLSITILAIGILTGTSTFATLNNCSDLLTIKIITGIVIFFGSFLSGYTQYYRFAERSEQHKFAASKYSNLHHNIKRELGLSRKDRQVAKDYVTWVTNQYDNFLLDCPEIEDNILKTYFDTYESNEGDNPTIVDISNRGVKDKTRDTYGIARGNADIELGLNPNNPNNDPVKNTSHRRKAIGGKEKNISTDPGKPRWTTPNAAQHALAVSSVKCKRRHARKKSVSNSIEMSSKTVPVKSLTVIQSPPESPSLATPTPSKSSTIDSKSHIALMKKGAAEVSEAQAKEYFRLMKSRLTNRTTPDFSSYFEKYDESLMNYQIERMNRDMNASQI